MTPEQQRIAIAEACPEIMRGGYFDNGTPMRHMGGNRFEKFDPLNDLNAMHQVEKSLDDVRNNYAYELQRITGSLEWSQIHVTASQRSEAFLRAIGKWID
jgi:hypothetical protein